MTSKPPICPLLTVASNSSNGMGVMEKCIQGRCAFWTTVYTTEGRPLAGCAITLIPGMNANAKFHV